jgi:hypothetical protein
VDHRSPLLPHGIAAVTDVAPERELELRADALVFNRKNRNPAAGTFMARVDAWNDAGIRCPASRGLAAGAGPVAAGARLRASAGHMSSTGDSCHARLARVLVAGEPVEHAMEQGRCPRWLRAWNPG